MDQDLQRDRLEWVSTMAEILADLTLTEHRTSGTFPSEKGSTLSLASLLLEECEHPVPEIVADVLAQFRQDIVGDDEDAPERVMTLADRPVDGAGRRGRLFRLFRSMRPEASA